MRFYCSYCRTILDEEDLREVEEPRGEAWGQPCYETISVCPICGEIPMHYSGGDDEDNET